MCSKCIHYEACKRLIDPNNEELIKCELFKPVSVKPLETDAYPHRLYCPSCYFTFCYNKMNIDGIKALQMYNHCPDCGQGIDWSEVTIND